MKIGKYEFKDKSTADAKIKALGVSTDEDGNEYPTHSHSIVKLGHIVLEQPELDEDGEVIKEAVLSENYHLDVAWNEKEITTIEEEAILDEDGMVITPEVISIDHPYGWKSASVDIETNGVHSFFGIDYLAHKI